MGVREGPDPWASARALLADEPTTSRFASGLIVGGSFFEFLAGGVLRRLGSRQWVDYFQALRPCSRNPRSDSGTELVDALENGCLRFIPALHSLSASKLRYRVCRCYGKWVSAIVEEDLGTSPNNQQLSLISSFMKPLGVYVP